MREDASLTHVRYVLEFHADVPNAAVILKVHENTIRHYMKRAGITPENVREWKNQRMRQRTMQFNGK